MQEQRKFIRVKPDPKQPIEVQIIGTDFIDILEARNISEGGAKVEVPHLFAGCDIGQPVQIIITLPGRRSFKTSGQVKHIRGGDHPAFGMRFIDLEPADQEAVRQYVAGRVKLGATA